jgi:hypothetical protein
MQSASLQNMQGIFYQIQMASIELAACANKALRWAELQQVLPRIRPETRQSDRVKQRTVVKHPVISDDPLYLFRYLQERALPVVKHTPVDEPPEE